MLRIFKRVLQCSAHTRKKSFAIMASHCSSFPSFSRHKINAWCFITVAPKVLILIVLDRPSLAYSWLWSGARNRDNLGFSIQHLLKQHIAAAATFIGHFLQRLSPHCDWPKAREWNYEARICNIFAGKISCKMHEMNFR